MTQKASGFCFSFIHFSCIIQFGILGNYTVNIIFILAHKAYLLSWGISRMPAVLKWDINKNINSCEWYNRSWAHSSPRSHRLSETLIQGNPPSVFSRPVGLLAFESQPFKTSTTMFLFLDFFLSVEEAQSQERTGDEKATPYSFQTLLRLWGVTDWTLDIKLTRDWYCETDIFIYIFFYLHSTRKHNILLWQQKKTLPRMLEICLPRICGCF